MKMIKVLLVSLLINLPTFFSSQVSTDIALYTERLSIFYFFKTNKNNSVHFCQYSDSSDTFISCHFKNSCEAKMCPVVMLCGGQLFDAFTFSAHKRSAHDILNH